MKRNFHFPTYGYAGLAIIAVSEIGLFLKLWLFTTFMTPLCWTGLILFLDGLNFSLAGDSLIQTRRKEFFWMLPSSIALWYVFEFYNLFIHNWHYVGLPENRWVRYGGYFWSFATIWPGVLEIYDFIRNMNWFANLKIKPLRLSGALLAASFVTGLLFLVWPLVVSEETARYLAAPVWVGMVLLLDPLNYAWRRQSIWEDFSQGNLSRLIQLLVAGLIAGFLWEFWNFWATAKWIYTVPILGDIKLFEMPLVGYLGFPPFAVEIFVMWETVKHFLRLK